MKNLATFAMILTILLSPILATAEWTQQQVQDLTTEFRKYKQNWTIQQTEDLLKKSKNDGTLQTGIRADNGNFVGIEIKGHTVLLDGKDITGNLGSKTTYGDNSPIIEDIQNSQITTGDKSPIQKDITRTTIFNIHIVIYFALSIALTVSFIFNIAFYRRFRKQKAGNKTLHPDS